MKTLTNEHAARLRERRLDPELALRLGIWSKGNAIAFDYMKRGEVYNTKLRFGKGEMPWEQKGKPLILWNYDALLAEVTADDILIITEGEPDAVACIQVGYETTTSVPNGGTRTNDMPGDDQRAFKYLFTGQGQLDPNIDKFSKIILATDNDDVGATLRDSLGVRLGDDRCWWVDWGDGCKDANDVLIKRGADALRACIEGARRMWSDEVRTLSEIPDPPPERALPMGFFYPGRTKDEEGWPQPTQSRLLSLPEKGLWTVMGPYESGKSTFVRQVAYNMATMHQWKFAITCFEESSKWRTVNVLRKLRGAADVSKLTERELKEADEWIEDKVVFIEKARRKLMTADRLFDRIEFAAKVHGVNLCIVDPFNQVDHRWETSKSKTDYIGDFLKDCHEVAKDYRMLLCMCVHPPAGQLRANQLKKKSFYTLADVADSAHFANASDIGFCLWRHGGFTYLNMDKVKNRDLCGEPTGAVFGFDRKRERYMVLRTGWDSIDPERAEQFEKEEREKDKAARKEAEKQEEAKQSEWLNL